MTEEIRLTTEVLNCDYFNRNRGFNCYKGKNCTEVPDCYYRQLKRLEQENKELKEKIDAFKTMATVPTRMYNECERERCKYGRALEEIRVIADDTFKVCDDDCGNARKIKLIIDIINECIGEN